MPHILMPKIQQVDIRQEGTRVLVIASGQAILDVPYEAALQLARAIYIKAKQAEEFDKANAIIGDQAILTRLGIPMGLTNNPAMLQEAMKEAAWNTKLRRSIPLARAGGIKSQAVFGTPSIKKSPPPKKETT